MAQLHPAWLEHQRRRWTRSAAHLWLRPDRDRFLRSPRYERKYSPDRPRVPAGNPDGGRWTNSDGSAGTASSASVRSKPGNSSGAGRNDPRVLSDATPDNEWTPGAQYAQATQGSRLADARAGGPAHQSTSGDGSTDSGYSKLAARRISPAIEAQCEEQYARDIISCNMVRTPTCYAQAAERYAACLAGRPIPPLNF